MEMEADDYRKFKVLDGASRIISSVRSGSIGVIIALAVLEIVQEEIHLLEIVRQPHILRAALIAVCLHIAHILLTNTLRNHLTLTLNPPTGDNNDDKEND